MPTNFAFLDNGGFLLADGYGSFYIHEYDKDGNPGEIRTVEVLGLSREIQNLCSLNRGLVVVTGPTAALGRVFSGAETWIAAERSGALRVDGPPRPTRSLSRWFLPSPLADDMRRATLLRS